MSALTDALAYLGGAIDKPGRAVRGGLAGRPDELLAAVPFSDSLGLTDPGRSVSGRDLLGMSGLSTGHSLADEGLGLAAELALDPTTYLGAGLAARLGARAGGALASAAARRGPGYATTADDLVRATRMGAGFAADPDEVAKLLSRAPGVAAEVPPGSRFLGAGAEAVAFRTPADDVVRIGAAGPGAAGRPVSDNVLQATRGADYGGLRAERLPFAQKVGDEAVWGPGGRSARPDSGIGRLRSRMEDEGLDFADPHAGNVGLHGGRARVIDPGAVEALPGFAGGFQDVTTAGRPGLLTRALLDLLGGRGAMRRALDAGRAAPGYATGLGRAGAVGGASLGLTG